MPNKYDAVMASLNSYFLPFRLDYSESDILELEKNLGGRLPEDYRSFIEKYSFACLPGYATYSEIRRPGKEGGVVEFFFGFNSAHSRDLNRGAKAFDGRIPDRYLPIAASPGGVICICLSGPERGGVYWWDRAEDEDDPEKNMILIWPDFDGFIRSLKPAPP